MTCQNCGEEILEGEQCGHMLAGAFMHHECATRTILGSVGHQLQICSCYGGDYEDPPELKTRREQAKAALEVAVFMRKMQGVRDFNVANVHDIITIMTLVGLKTRIADLKKLVYRVDGKVVAHGVRVEIPHLLTRDDLEAAFSIVCPRCKRRSFNPNDVQQRYCGACHEYHDTMDLDVKEE